MIQLPSSVRDEAFVISACSRKIVTYIMSLHHYFNWTRVVLVAFSDGIF